MQHRSLARRATPLLAAVTTLAAATVHAQGAVSSQCASQLFVAVDACQKAVDLFNFMAPQLGTSITGGNAVIGSAGTLGGLGHFSFGVRANILQGQLPQTDDVTLSVTSAQRSDFAPKRQLLGLPTAEAAVGIFPGVNVGATNVGGIDALVSAFYVPDIEEDPVSVRVTDGHLRIGYGVRLGIVQETAFVPGISVSYLRRDLPKVDLRARIGTADSVRVTDLEAKTTVWRLAASKRFTILGLTAGVGQDRYDSQANTGAYVAPRQVGPVSVSYNGTVAGVSQKLTRTNYFGGAMLALPGLRVAAEIGQVTGGDVVTPFNSFGDRKANDTYTYGSLGLRVAF